MAKHNEFGDLGEQMAVDFLRDKGYSILERNYRYQKAEVDIVAQKEEILAIVEVKSRTSGFLGDVSHTISQKKIALLTLAADHYVQECQLDVEVRFDVVLVLKNNNGYRIEHLKEAFHHF